MQTRAIDTADINQSRAREEAVSVGLFRMASTADKFQQFGPCHDNSITRLFEPNLESHCTTPPANLKANQAFQIGHFIFCWRS